MALTRRALKAMGIDEEKIDEIIAMHTDTVDGLKADLAKYKADAEALPGVKAQVKYDAVKEEYDGYKAEQAKKETHAAKEKAYRALLKAAGISEKRLDSVLRVSDVDSVELDEKGEIKDADKLTQQVKTEWADFIQTITTRGAQTATPPAVSGGKKLSKDDIFRKDDRGRYVMGTAERQRAIAENLDAFSGGNN